MGELPKRVLAVGAHPDDLELTCAGTLARFRAAGSEVILAVVCKGEKGGAAGSCQELAATREQEARAAAAILGATIHFLGLPDGAVFDTPQTRTMFVTLFRKTRPELIITHGPDDYHDDHVRVHHLALNASWFSASPGQRTEHPPLPVVPAVICADNMAGIRFDPTHYVDISQTYEIKRQMIECHVSQTSRADSGMHRLLEMAQTLARLRGLQCGVQYAEGFQPVSVFGRRRAEPLLP